MIWRRVYRMMLRLLPRELWQKHGAAMEALYAHELERGRESGWTGVLGAGVGGVLDVIRRCAYERALRRVQRGGAPASGRRRSSSGNGGGGDLFRHDAAQSLRSLRRSPTFGAVAVLTLALGIGVNGAIFAIVDTVLIRPLPFPDAERVVQLAWDGGGYLQRLSPTKFEYWKERSRSFEAFATWQMLPGRVQIGDEASTVQVLGASQDILDVLGYHPLTGRPFSPADFTVSQPRVALLAHSEWVSRFGASADVIGQSMRLNGQFVTIVGVLPPSFEFPYEEQIIDVVVPMRVTPDPGSVAEDWPVIARLAEGFTRAMARADVETLNGPFRATHPEQASPGDRGMRLATFTELYVPQGVRHALWLLMGTVTLVVLIACGNVTSLYLARATARRGDLALRAALGGGRVHRARLLLLEHAFLGLAAGGIGAVLAAWMSSLLVGLSPMHVARLPNVEMDGRTTLYVLIAAVVASMGCGVPSVLQSVRGGVWQPLRDVTRGGGGKRLRQSLLVTQSALSMTLLVGAGLLLATWVGLRRADAGFDDGMLTAVRLPASSPAATPLPAAELEQRLLDRLAGSPFAVSIAVAGNLPFERGINTPVTISGRPDDWGTVEWRAVTPSYFGTIGMTVVSGRPFEATDVADGRQVAIVNESFAQRFFGGASALGQRIDVGAVRGVRRDTTQSANVVEVVGVVTDIREQSVRHDPRGTLYVPRTQAPARLLNVMRAPPVLIVRERSEGVLAAREVAGALGDIDPELANAEILTISDLRSRTLARERFGAAILSLLAVLAVLLTGLGIYGVLACSVEQRRREIGIRMALGAAQDRVARTIALQGLIPVLSGLALGILTSMGLASLIAAYLWNVSPKDPQTIAAVAAILIAVAIVAAWAPARRAAALQPAETLNQE